MVFFLSYEISVLSWRCRYVACNVSEFVDFAVTDRTELRSFVFLLCRPLFLK